MIELLRAGSTKVKTIAWAIWGEVSETAVAIFQFPVKITTLQGPLKGGADGEAATLLYIGRGANLLHFKNKFFKEVKTVRSENANLLTYRKHLATADANADVVFVDIGWPYNGRINRRGDYLELPDWVFLVTPLAETWDGTVQNFRKTMRKNIKRLIRKNEYRCEPTNDPEFIESFYDDYYNAFINSRFSDETVMTARRDVERRAREGTILRVIGPDGPVAAGVYFPHSDSLCLLASGMPEALVDNPPEAAISALYYFSLQYAFDHGYKAVNFLGTRAFPDDGLFQFKRKWGAVIEDGMSVDSILFKPMSDNPKAARFCELFPLISRRGKALELVLAATRQDLSEADYDRLVANSHCGGIERVRIVTVADQNAATVQRSADDPNVEIMRTSLTDFSAVYAGK